MSVNATQIASSTALLLHQTSIQNNAVAAFDIERGIEIVRQAYPHLPEPIVCGMVERVMQSALGAQLQNLERAICDMETCAVTQELGGTEVRVLQAVVHQLVAQLHDLHRTLNILWEKSK